MPKAYHRRPEHRARKTSARAARERARILEAFDAYASGAADPARVFALPCVAAGCLNPHHAKGN